MTSTTTEQRRATRTFVELQDLNATEFGDIIALEDPIVTAAGKNLSPNNIEEAIKTKSPIIDSMVVYGDAKPFVTALVVLDPEAFPVWAEQHGVPAGDPAAADHPAVQEEVALAVAAGNEELSRVEQVKKWTVLGQEWTPDSGELTPTMKLKRTVVHDRYRDQIEAMY